jgi:hypothetical protein
MSKPTARQWVNILHAEKKPQGLERYPEFRDVVNKIVGDTVKQINDFAPQVKSEMIYNEQFVLEEVIKELQHRV